MTITFGGTGESSADTIAVRHSGIEMLPELGCANHEEADTRLIAHMVYNCRMFNRSRIVVHVNDTDIIPLCMYCTITKKLETSLSYRFRETTNIWLFINLYGTIFH